MKKGEEYDNDMMDECVDESEDDDEDSTFKSSKGMRPPRKQHSEEEEDDEEEEAMFDAESESGDVEAAAIKIRKKKRAHQAVVIRMTIIDYKVNNGLVYQLLNSASISSLFLASRCSYCQNHLVICSLYPGPH
jgi:hypothetical protein